MYVLMSLCLLQRRRRLRRRLSDAELSLLTASAGRKLQRGIYTPRVTTTSSCRHPICSPLGDATCVAAGSGMCIKMCVDAHTGGSGLPAACVRRRWPSNEHKRERLVASIATTARRIAAGTVRRRRRSFPRGVPRSAGGAAAIVAFAAALSSRWRGRRWRKSRAPARRFSRSGP